MFKSNSLVAYSLAIVLGCALSSGANSSTVTVGSFTFGIGGFADTASISPDSFGDPAQTDRAIRFVDRVINQDPLTFGMAFGQALGTGLESGDQLDADIFVEVGFTNNKVFNRPGLDILAFETGIFAQPVLLSLSAGPGVEQLAPTFQETSRVGPTNAGVFIFGFDLSDIGIAENAEFTGSLFFEKLINSGQNTNGDPSLSGVLALNTIATPSADVPTPATFPLLVGGLGALGLVVWRRKWAVAT